MYKRLYDATLRKVLPKNRIIWNNGVPISEATVLDRTRSRPKYKDAAIAALREHVQPTDEVTIIGGGLGVSAVVAARRGSHCYVFEAAGSIVTNIEELCRRLRIKDLVTVKHATVGEANNDNAVWGTDQGPPHNPEELPDSDVIEIDCEGAEAEIIPALTTRPRVVIVEIHRCFGVAVNNISQPLQERGYEIIRHGDDDSATPTLVAVRERDAEGPSLSSGEHR